MSERSKTARLRSKKLLGVFSRKDAGVKETIYIPRGFCYHNAMKPTIPFDIFAQVDLQVGKIITCVKKEGSEKLLRLNVDFGSEQRTIFTGLAQFYTPEDFEGKLFVFVVNLEPRKMMDEFSEGMLLCADAETPIPIVPTQVVPPGTTLR